MEHRALKDINLWKKQLGSAPDWVREREDAETLVLAENGLREISDKIGRLKKLRMLDLGHNELESVPESPGDLQDNRLRGLPASLARLTGLRYLNIGENQFEELPGMRVRHDRAGGTENFRQPHRTVAGFVEAANGITGIALSE